MSGGGAGSDSRRPVRWRVFGTATPSPLCPSSAQEQHIRFEVSDASEFVHLACNADGSAFVHHDKRFAVEPWKSLSFLPSVPVGRWVNSAERMYMVHSAV